MKILALKPSPNRVTVIFVEGDKVTFAVPFRDEWPVSEEDESRIGDLGEVRKRLIENIVQMDPDAVCVTPFEPFALTKSKPTMAVFRTAELRGVLLEGAHSTGKPTELRAKKLVNSTVGSRKSQKYTDDNSFWRHLGPKFQKKYRELTLVALSKIRE